MVFIRVGSRLVRTSELRIDVFPAVKRVLPADKKKAFEKQRRRTDRELKKGA
jgi:hypothetical protein